MVNSIPSSNGFKPINSDVSKPVKSDKKTENTPVADSHVALERIDKLKSTMQSASEINQARVEFLKNALANGQYKVDSLVIAEKLSTEFK